MGQKGREILEIDVNEVIDDLNSAYADEWLAHFQYFLFSQVIEGAIQNQISGYVPVIINNRAI
jgi:bacterioferritin